MVLLDGHLTNFTGSLIFIYSLNLLYWSARGIESPKLKGSSSEDALTGDQSEPEVMDMGVIELLVGEVEASETDVCEGTGSDAMGVEVVVDVVDCLCVSKNVLGYGKGQRTV